MDAEKGIVGLMANRMTWLNERQRVLAENVSNADTPNYKARDLVEPDFKTTLQQVMVAPKLTNARHIQTRAELAPGIVEKVVGSTETSLSGNAVDLETEMTKISSTAVEYQAMTGLLKKWHGMFRLAMGKQQ
ncbi:MAG: flagellar basal body rod protein FlgB [Alphaproteobacteria bacterium]|nr:flagellar basal body rod protein FlgB [Alphaproteobacteria bacterium]